MTSEIIDGIKADPSGSPAVFVFAHFFPGAAPEPETWERVLAIENGYVIEDAADLLMAATKKVTAAEGFSFLLRRRIAYLSISLRKNVIDGFRVRISDAEYPDQNPPMPFSARIFAAISDELEEDPDVCFRATIFDNGVVKSFENAPANTPIANSSRTGKTVCFDRR